MKHFFITLFAALFAAQASLASFSIVPSSGGICIGSTVYLTDSAGGTGGIWSSSAPAIATIGTAGDLTGISAGIVTVTYSVGISYATGVFTVTATPAGIAGATSVCPGATTALTDVTLGGTWYSSTPAVASVGSSTGIVSGVAAGTATISYTVGSTYATVSVTVGSMPATITGGTTPLCPGTTTSLIDLTPGGTWHSSAPSVATVGSTTGIVTGITCCLTVISYTVPGDCPATTLVTVNPTYLGSILGPGAVCAGDSIALTDSVYWYGGGGTWSSSNIAVAPVGSLSGVVTGVAAGVATITFTGICGTFITRMVTVSATTSAGAIVGPSSVAVGGAVITLTNPTASAGTYTWASSSPLVASVGAGTGIVTGLSLGSTIITYSVTGCGGAAFTTTSVNVVPLDGISGIVHFGGGGYWPTDTVKVWLIAYDPATFNLQAIDSITYWGVGGIIDIYYQFTGLPTDSFRVKAAIVNNSMTMVTGFLPTYHTSYFYWHDADVIYHTSGGSDINKDIVMLIGTITSGPGFIGGSVLTGANKGTSGGVPVRGLKMCIVNSATHQLMGAAYTNSSGAYSFSSLPVGQTYYVFPDSLNYLTTPYTSITLTSGSPSVTTASFIQHTLSKTITPKQTSVPGISTAAAYVIVYPNPTKGTISVRWFEPGNETVTIMISDLAGHLLHKENTQFIAGTGIKQIGLSDLAPGSYILSFSSASINQTEKIVLEK